MPATLTLNTQIPPAFQNATTALAITTTPDTVTIIVDPNWPRIVLFAPGVDMLWRLDNNANATISASAPLTLEIPARSVFTVACVAASGTLNMTVLR